MVENLCATPGTSFSGLVKSFCAGLKKSVSEAFLVGCNASHFHSDTAVDGITLRFLGDAVLKDGRGSTNGKDVVDPTVNPEVIKL